MVRTTRDSEQSSLIIIVIIIVVVTVVVVLFGRSVFFLEHALFDLTELLRELFVALEHLLDAPVRFLWRDLGRRRLCRAQVFQQWRVFALV